MYRKIIEEKIHLYKEVNDAGFFDELCVNGIPFYSQRDEEYGVDSVMFGSLRINRTFDLSYNSVFEILSYMVISIKESETRKYYELVPTLLELPFPKESNEKKVFSHLIHHILKNLLSVEKADKESNSKKIEKMKNYLEVYSDEEKWGLTEFADEDDTMEIILKTFKYIKESNIHKYKDHEFYEIIEGRVLEEPMYDSFEGDEVLDIAGIKTFYPKYRNEEEGVLDLSYIPIRNPDDGFTDLLDLALLLASNIEYNKTVRWCNYYDVLNYHYNERFMGDPINSLFVEHFILYIREKMDILADCPLKPIACKPESRHSIESYVIETYFGDYFDKVHKPDEECQTRALSKNITLLENMFVNGIRVREFAIDYHDEGYRSEYDISGIKILKGDKGVETRSVVGALLGLAIQVARDNENEESSMDYYILTDYLRGMEYQLDGIGKVFIEHLKKFIFDNNPEDFRSKKEYYSKEIIDCINKRIEENMYGFSFSPPENAVISFDNRPIWRGNALDTIVNSHFYIDRGDVEKFMDLEIDDTTIRRYIRKDLPIKIGGMRKEILLSSSEVLDINGIETFYLDTSSEKIEDPRYLTYKKIPTLRSPTGKAFELAVLIATNLKESPDEQWHNYESLLSKNMGKANSWIFSGDDEKRLYAHFMRYSAEQALKFVEEETDDDIDDFNSKNNDFGENSSREDGSEESEEESENESRNGDESEDE